MNYVVYDHYRRVNRGVLCSSSDAFKLKLALERDNREPGPFSVIGESLPPPPGGDLVVPKYKLGDLVEYCYEGRSRFGEIVKVKIEKTKSGIDIEYVIDPPHSWFIESAIVATLTRTPT